VGVSVDRVGVDPSFCGFPHQGQTNSNKKEETHVSSAGEVSVKHDPTPAGPARNAKVLALPSNPV